MDLIDPQMVRCIVPRLGWLVTPFGTDLSAVSECYKSHLVFPHTLPHLWLDSWGDICGSYGGL